MSVTISGSGQIIKQVVQVQLTNIQSFSPGALTWTNVTGASASITPSNSANKILVMYSCMAQTNTPTPYYGTYTRITRNGTAVAVGTTGTGVLAGAWGFAATSGYASQQSQVFLDSPNTTSAVTYQLQVTGESSAVVVGGSYNSYSSGGGNPNIPTSIILLEVAYA